MNSRLLWKLLGYLTTLRCSWLYIVKFTYGFQDPTPSCPMFQVDKFQRSAKTTAKEHESALANSTAKLSVAEAAIGRAYIAGGGVDAEFQHAQAANKELESRV